METGCLIVIACNLEYGEKGDGIEGSDMNKWWVIMGN